MKFRYLIVIIFLIGLIVKATEGPPEKPVQATVKVAVPQEPAQSTVALKEPATLKKARTVLDQAHKDELAKRAADESARQLARQAAINIIRGWPKVVDVSWVDDALWVSVFPENEFPIVWVCKALDGQGVKGRVYVKMFDAYAVAVKEWEILTRGECGR